RGGRCTLSFSSQEQLNNMLGCLSLDRTLAFMAVTPCSSARKARRDTPVSCTPATARPASPTLTGTHPAQLLSPIMLHLRTPPNSPTSFVLSPLTLTDSTLSPMIFAPVLDSPATLAVPVPDPPPHPTASYDGRSAFILLEWAVPQRWVSLYCPWARKLKVGKKWHVVFIGFEIGVFFDSWDRVQLLACLPFELSGYADAKYHSYASWNNAMEAWRCGPVRRQAYPFPR
ncbi:hypothetical protein BDN71DRAFT_1439041, partial [Pleurotus eryngii]